MKYSAKTIRILIRLRDGESVNEGECRSGQIKGILDKLKEKNAISFIRIGKSRGTYQAITKERFVGICQELDRVLLDLDVTLRLAENDFTSRADKVAFFGNSKQDRADRTIKGFTILADRETVVNYLGRDITINPLVGLHIIDRWSLVIPANATIIVVENAECLYNLKWINNINLDYNNGPYIILCRFPICEEAKLWLTSIPNEILYFGDFDLAGIRIYETEFKKRLKGHIRLIIPIDLEQRMRQYGNPELYTKQINEGFANYQSQSKTLSALIRLIHHLQSSLEQESYCIP